jgi:hypothetical protein
LSGKRTGTKPGMGAVRTSRPPKTSKRPAPIVVPSVHMPRIEDLGRRDTAPRGTLKRKPSSDSKHKAQKIATPSSRIGVGTVAALTPNARHRKDKQIEPSDAFLLSRIDGQLQAHELADLTGMSEREVITSLKRLVKAGLVTIA